MSEEQAIEGAEWVCETLARLMQELGVELRGGGYTFLSPEDAGGHYFDRELWVLTGRGKSGQPVRVEFPQEHLEDLPNSKNVRANIEQRLRDWLGQVGFARRTALADGNSGTAPGGLSTVTAPPRRDTVRCPGLTGIVDKFEDKRSSPNATPPLRVGGGESSVTRTLVFTDLEAHTAMMQRLGDERGSEVLRAYADVTRRLLRRYGGREVKTMGDGFLLAFPSASSALDWAGALQNEVGLVGKGCGESLRIRVGVNAGEPIAEENDFIGTAVSVAARIVDLADGGDVLVSDVVRQLVAGKSFKFEDLGERRLKGFETPIRIWKLRLD